MPKFTLSQAQGKLVGYGDEEWSPADEDEEWLPEQEKQHAERIPAAPPRGPTVRPRAAASWPLTSTFRGVTCSTDIFLRHSKTTLTKAEMVLIRNDQFDTCHSYKSEFFFPHDKVGPGSKDVFDRDSYLLATKYVCHGKYNCSFGDCLSVFQTSDIQTMRQRTASRCTLDSHDLKAPGPIPQMCSILQMDLSHAYDRTNDRWNLVNVPLDAYTSHYVCPSAYALLVGATSATFRRAAAAIKRGDQLSATTVHQWTTMTTNEQQSHLSVDRALLGSYVRTLLTKHEANPAPGAHQPGRMTHITKQTWKFKWEACKQHFKASKAGRPPGSQSMLKRVWKEEKRLKERRACSHSKCDLCSKIDAEYERLRGNNTKQAIVIRQHLKKAYEEHEEAHLADRTVFDDAGQLATSDPRSQWTICVDAATQRNFELPKFQFRTPKLFARCPFWGFKFMAVYAFGFGFMPFLVHDSQTMGSNLTWTVSWLALCRMRDHFGYWPESLHIQLDNTTGENKNKIMVAFCAWLVASGKVKHVRVFFLKVGHTHIIIDHIFGVVTVGLRRIELMTPEALMANIDASLGANSHYMAHATVWLHCLFDVKEWTQTQMGHHLLTRIAKGEVTDAQGQYAGMYDLQFRPDRNDFARMQYREDQSHAWWPADSPGVLTIKQLPTSPPRLQEIRPFNKWGKIGTKLFLGTVALVIRFARTLANPSDQSHILRIWEQHVRDVPSIIALLKPEFKIEFRHFSSEFEVPLLRAPSEPILPGTEEDLTFDKYCLAFLGGMRKGPFAIDPVVSSEQSEAQFQRAKKDMVDMTRVFRGPSTNATSRVFNGDFVFATTAGAGAGVTLFQVKTLARLQTPSTEGLQLNCVMLDHTPNPDVSGFFGTFKRGTEREGTVDHLKAKIVLRQDIVVYNVELDGKTKMVSLESIRCLCRRCPDVYQMPSHPQVIPMSHLPKDDDEEDEEDEAVLPKRARRQPKKSNVNKKPKPKRKQKKRKKTNEDEDDEDEDDDEDGDEEEHEDGSVGSEDWTGRGRMDENGGADQGHKRTTRGLYQEGHEDEDDEDKDEGVGEDADEDGSDDDELSTDEEEDENDEDDEAQLPRLTGPTIHFVPKPNTMVFLNMCGDAEFGDQLYPTVPVFITAVRGDKMDIKWYTKTWSGRTFKSTNVYVTYEKFWTDPDFATKEGLKKRDKPSKEIVDKWWSQQEFDTTLCIPLEVPMTLKLDAVWRNDTIKFPMKWMQDMLIPVLIKNNCVHELRTKRKQ